MLEAAIATEEAALEKEKAGFIEKEKALQQQQHAFNELNNTVREKENEKSLSAQRLQYLREREGRLKRIFAKSRRTIKRHRRKHRVHQSFRLQKKTKSLRI